MKMLKVSAVLTAAGLLAAAPVFAQTPQTKPTQDGNSPAMVGPASAANVKKTQDGNSPAMVGPASAANVKKTQDGNSPAMVGPASVAGKQHTQTLTHAGETTRDKVKEN